MNRTFPKSGSAYYEIICQKIFKLCVMCLYEETNLFQIFKAFMAVLFHILSVFPEL